MQASQRHRINLDQKHRGVRCAIENNKVAAAAFFDAKRKLSEPAGFPNLLRLEANDSIYALRQAARLGRRLGWRLGRT